MTDREREKMLELLSDRAIFGLTDEEKEELAELEKRFPEFREEELGDSLELSAAAVSMMDLDTSEPLPAHLRAKITADAERFFASRDAEAAPPEAANEEYQKTFAFEPKRTRWSSWLGWAVAALACVALAGNLWTTRLNPNNNTAGINPTPTATPGREPTLTEQREQLLASAKDAVQTSWSEFDPKNPRKVEGDVVWSNAAQKGFVRFRNLPVNDKTKETYQLWIFDKNQKNPVSAGVFDVNQSGEVIVPLDSMLKIQEPTMFAVTAEKPGGVMVSPLEKVMAVAKI